MGGDPRESAPASVFSMRVRVGPFVIDVDSDDPRIIRAIEERALDDHATAGVGAEADEPARRMRLRLSTVGANWPMALPRREEAAATFEDVELHSSPKSNTLVVGRGTVVVIDLERKHAEGRVTEEHLARPWVVAHRIFSLSVIELLRSCGAYYVHAGCVCQGEKGVLICGASGEGKSTLTYALARSGFSFLSDDGVFLWRSSAGLEVFSWPEKIKLDRHSCSFFEELRSFAKSPGKIEIPLRSTCIRRVSGRARPVALIVPVRNNAVSSEIRSIPRHDALVRVLGQTIPLLAPDSVNAQLDILTELVTSCSCFELKAGLDFGRIPAVVAEATGVRALVGGTG